MSVKNTETTITTETSGVQNETSVVDDETDTAPLQATTTENVDAIESLEAVDAESASLLNEASDEKDATETQNLDISQSKPFNLEHALPLNPDSFPNQPRKGSNVIPPTIANVKNLLKRYDVNARYNVICKKPNITLPGVSGTVENYDSIAMTHIINLANLNGMSASSIPEIVMAIADQNQFNPAADWIRSKPWDGVDRIPTICETIMAQDDFSDELKIVLMYRWLLSVAAAALVISGFKARGVLTLQGAQSKGKSSWIGSLVPDEMLRAMLVKGEFHLDGANKDSVLTAISHWIVEIGELDSSFKKDIARQKALLTADRDKIRVPYGRTACEYPRRTVFAATVNDSNFLVDTTGNSRWWTICVKSINYKHGIDMQQVFAQLAVDLDKGEQWWLTPKEEIELEKSNANHKAISVIYELIVSALDIDRIGESNLPAMSAIELLKHLGIERPRNADCKECAAILRDMLGEHKRINGINKWRIPLVKKQSFNRFHDDDDY